MQTCNKHPQGFECQLPGAAWIIAIACLTPSLALADAEDSFNFAAGASVRYDDNLFRLADNAPTPNGASAKSDTLLTTYAGIRFDRAYDLQRVQLDVTATSYNYRNNDYLNFTALDYRAAWLWAISPRLTGSLFADSTSQVTSYTNLQNINTPNRRSIENQGFLADWLVDGGWHLTGGAYRLRSKTDSAELTSFGNYVQNTAEAGVKYVSTANNSLALVQRMANGDYIDQVLNPVRFLDPRYNQSDTELRSIYQVTGHSRLDTRIGYRDRAYESYSQRDFSGAVGAISYLWTPTGKLQFTLTAGRDLLAYQADTSSYYTSNYVNFTPAWLVSDKTTLRLKLDMYKNKFAGAVVPVAELREDKIYTTQLALAWRPTRTVVLDSYLLHEDRSSNIAGLPYKANVVGLSASATF
jgi:exopolysaccharide biosynthesis operon protein EpsL